MQRTRNVVLISVVVAAAILIGAFALAAYRREVVAEAEEHEHEFMDHEHMSMDHEHVSMDHDHGAPAVHDSVPAGASAERRESRPDAEEPAPSPAPNEPQAQAEPAHDQANHGHHDH